MARWIRIASLADCPPNAALEAVADDRVVALFNVDGQLYALDGVCPHQGGPLGKGALNGAVVTCPWHGFQFDVRTGRHATSARLVQPCLPVKVEEGEVFVDVDSY
jgi:nitrite reductase (NADH) small subunit